jgi:hypothetical protein
VLVVLCETPQGLTAADRIGDGVVVDADQLAQILRVKPRRERGRADSLLIEPHHAS